MSTEVPLSEPLHIPSREGEKSDVIALFYYYAWDCYYLCESIVLL